MRIVVLYRAIHAANSNSRTSNCQCSLFSKKKNPLCGFSAYPDDPTPHSLRIKGALLYFDLYTFRYQEQYKI